MARFLLRKPIPLRFLPTTAGFQTCSASTELGFRALEKKEKESEPNAPTIWRMLSPLLSFRSGYPGSFHFELVDPDLWQVSSGLAYSWRESSKGLAFEEVAAEAAAEEEKEEEDCFDIDEIEDLRLRKKLFYKLDRESREYEEYNHLLPRKKSSKRGLVKPARSSIKDESKKKGKPDPPSRRKCTSVARENGGSRLERQPVEGRKKLRNPTYNQLTDPYHLPFCLDIYVSKGSVRACIVHKATSKVVTVAHSISKDMKFDLTSRKNAAACAAVGKVLAQRAIADDIHNVVYTPRKGEKIEGKLQIVLESIIENGIDVKLKIKQRRTLKRITESTHQD